jgi:hypothetical protein
MSYPGSSAELPDDYRDARHEQRRHDDASAGHARASGYWDKEATLEAEARAERAALNTQPINGNLYLLDDDRNCTECGGKDRICWRCGGHGSNGIAILGVTQ